MEKKILEAQLKILLELPYMTAYTGSFDKVEQRSFVLYSEITKRISKIREELQEAYVAHQAER